MLLATLFGDRASAQANTPDAGSLRQQIEQPRTAPLPSAAPRTPAAPQLAPAAVPAGATVTVRGFRFAGATLLDQARLQDAVAPYLNRPLDFAALSRAAEAVAQAYQQAGWLVRAFLPAQGIEDGVVTVQVVESRFGGMRWEGGQSARVARSDIEAYILQQQAPGAFLSIHALDRGLLLADDLPGVSVAGTLVPGPGEGQTSLVLQSTDEPLLYGEASLDNQGARSTGTLRQTLNINVNSPGGRGELASLNLLHSQGMAYGRVALTVPAGDDGLRLGVNASALNFEVVDGPGATTASPIRGRSSSLGLEWSRPLVRERLANVYLSGGLEAKRFYTADSQVRSDYGTDVVRLGLSGNRFDEVAGGGANSGSAQMSWGRLGDIVAHPQDQALAGSFRKLVYSISRQQTLVPGHSLFVTLQGQHAAQRLDSSEKFYIGGASSVRAYPSSELGGDRGQVLTGEWRWRPSPEWTLAAFVDLGRVVTLPATAGEANSRQHLRGRGLSAAWQGPSGLTARLTWAHRNGRNPQPTASGTDSDGTLHVNRLWLSASLAF